MTTIPKKPKITILKNGPYQVSGNLSIREEIMVADPHTGGADHLEKGTEHPHSEVTHLCRCGFSANKPFCDGNHSKIGFIGEEKASKAEYREGAEFYPGAGVDLLDKKEYCAIARFCHYGNGTWQDVSDSDDPEAKERAVYSASNCVAGRLTAVDKEGNLLEPPLTPAIGILQDQGKNCRGPLFIQ